MNILSNKIILSSSLFCSVYLFSSSLKKIIEAHQMNNLLSKNEIDRMFELTNTNYHNNIIYEKLIEYFNQYETENKGIFGIIHGDAVFSNCLIDNNNNFKLIDMRGKLDDVLTIYGDILYDYAKIYQSLIGYDEILFDKIVSNDYKTKMLNTYYTFIKNKFNDEYINIIKMITNSLLFTLIPLHNDNNHKCLDFYNLIDLESL